MENFLNELITRKSNEMKELKERSSKSEDLAEVRSINSQLEALDQEIAEARAQLDEMKKSDVPVGADLRNAQVVGSFAKEEKDADDMQYRTAFMRNVLKGTPIPAEFRDNQSTTTGDVTSAIPTVVVNQIIEKMDEVGMILPLVNKTSYKAGLVIPTSTVKPVATWVGSAENPHGEGAGSDTQKKSLGQITFSYYKLRCEISMSMEVGEMAVPAFEAKFVDNVVKAMVKEIENSIINGTGLYQPKGILAETAPSGQALTDTDYHWSKLVDAEGALPAEYEGTAKWCMSKKTFAKVQGMVDDNKQPISRVNFGLGGKLERTINGREVVISPYVEEGMMFMFDFSDYTLNTIYDMGIARKQDWDTEDLRTKAVMSVDGKVVSKDSLVTLKVGI